MTLPEYQYQMKAYELARVDKEYDMHLQAWLGRDLNASKKQGDKEVNVYSKFKDFFDYEKRIGEIQKPKVEQLNIQHKRMAQLAAKINK